MVGMHGTKWGGGWSGRYVMGSVNVETGLETVPSPQSCLRARSWFSSQKPVHVPGTMLN